MREHRAVLYTANGCVTQTRLRVCLVHNSMAFANQQGLYACVNVISIFHGKGPFLTLDIPAVTTFQAELGPSSVNLFQKGKDTTGIFSLV